MVETHNRPAVQCIRSGVVQG